MQTSKRRKNSLTAFEMVAGLKESSPRKINHVTGWKDTKDSSLARHVTRKPTDRKGTISKNIISFMKKRKNPVSLSDITSFVKNKRNMINNKRSTTNAIYREVLRLLNWNVLQLEGKMKKNSGRSFTTFSINNDLR